MDLFTDVRGWAPGPVDGLQAQEAPKAHFFSLLLVALDSTFLEPQRVNYTDGIP